MTTRTSAKPRRNPWPYAIVIYFILFIAFIAVFIAWAVRQNMDLVRKDYYHEEILFQKQIDTEARTRALGSEVIVRYNDAKRAISIQLPDEHARLPSTGRIHLYRPSDAKLDREVSLTPDTTGAQSIDASGLQPGLWKVRLNWKAAGQDFYFHQTIVIGG
jgi:nitrogen fixation protein FixH